MSSDTLFSTISQFPFPDSREIGEFVTFSSPLAFGCHVPMIFLCLQILLSTSTARAGRADFIQPSLGPLQPNFEDFMDFDLGMSDMNVAESAPTVIISFCKHFQTFLTV